MLLRGTAQTFSRPWFYDLTFLILQTLRTFYDREYFYISVDVIYPKFEVLCLAQRSQNSYVGYGFRLFYFIFLP